MGQYIVYQAKFPNGKVYIGYTGRTLKVRRKEHRNNKRCNPFHNALRKYGDSNVEWSVVATFSDIEEAYEAEQSIIKELDCIVPSGYNVKLGNGFADGYKLPPRSEEHRKKLSEAAKQRTGEKNPFFGKSHSEETKDKIRKARLGKAPSNRKQIIDQNGKLYSHAQVASRETGLSPKSVYNCCRQKRTIKGWTLRYVEV